MAARLRFYGTENIRRPATFIFVVPSRFSSWNGRRGGPQVGVQGDRFLIHTDPRLLRVIWPFVPLQTSPILTIYSSSRLATTHIFFPATASDRGSTGASEWFPFLPAEPICA